MNHDYESRDYGADFLYRLYDPFHFFYGIYLGRYVVTARENNKSIVSINHTALVLYAFLKFGFIMDAFIAIINIRQDDKAYSVLLHIINSFLCDYPGNGIAPSMGSFPPPRDFQPHDYGLILRLSGSRLSGLSRLLTFFICEKSDVIKKRNFYFIFLLIF